MTEGNKTCTGPRFPRVPDEQSAGFMHRPKIPRIPRFFGTLSGSFQKSWILGNLGPVHESCTLFIRILGNLGPVQVWWVFPIIEVTKPCTGPRFPRVLMNKMQDSCTGPRFPRIPRFWGTIKQDPDKVPKILGFLGILGLCMNRALCASGFLGILGLCRFYEGRMWNYVVCSKNMHFPCVFWWWTSEFVQRVFIFWSNFWKWRTGFWFCIIGCFLRQMIAIEIILHIVYSKNTGIYSGFCMCHNLKDEDEEHMWYTPSCR